MLGKMLSSENEMLSSENEMLDKMMDKNTGGNGGQRLLDCKTKNPHHPQLLKHLPPISPLPRSLSIYLIDLFHGAKLWFTSFCTAEALIKVNVIFSLAICVD